ncbi:MAG: hypothetical protein ACLRR3_02030 [Eubacterium sp.]
MITPTGFLLDYRRCYCSRISMKMTDLFYDLERIWRDGKHSGRYKLCIEL